MTRAYLAPHPPLLIPGIGSGGEIPDTRGAYERLASEIREVSPDTVIIISPHSILYSDYIHIAPGTEASGDFAAFRAKHIKFSVNYDAELAYLIGEFAEGRGIPAGPQGAKQPELDHGVMVPLYFLKCKRIVRISLSGLSLNEHYRFGMCISEAARALSRKIAVVASGDMSHKLKADGPYGFVPEGPEHDAFVCECVRSGAFLKLMSIDERLSERAAECGLRSLVMALGALDGTNVTSRVLSYEGPYGVGYLTAAFTGDGTAPSLLPQLSGENLSGDAFAMLARQNVEHYVKTGRMIALPEDLPGELLTRRAGVFVSIKKDGQLRGCIGTIAPTREHIAAEILQMSVSAACRDPRFNPIEPSELAYLSYSVDVLSPAEPASGLEALDVLRYGVIVSRGHRRGLLLPNLEGIDTVDKQIGIALQKAGIRPSEPYALERFEVVRHT